MFHRWSMCQVPESSSSSSPSSSDSSLDSSEGEEEEIKDTAAEEYTHKRYSMKDILLKLKENDGDIDLTVTEVLQDVTHNSLEHLNSQDDAEMIKKKERMRKRISGMKTKFKKFDKKRLEKQGANIFIAESQDSFVERLKNDESDEEEYMEVTEEKMYRKTLKELKDKDTMKKRTDQILETVREEAKKQGVTTTELLAYLMHRESYSRDKKLAREMKDLYKGAKLKENKVSDMKTLAMVVRGRFGRSTFFNVQRTLRPHKGLGQKLKKHCTLFQFLPNSNTFLMGFLIKC